MLRTDIRFVATSKAKNKIVLAANTAFDVSFSKSFVSEFDVKPYSVIAPERNMTVNKIRKVIS